MKERYSRRSGNSSHECDSRRPRDATLGRLGTIVCRSHHRRRGGGSAAVPSPRRETATRRRGHPSRPRSPFCRRKTIRHGGRPEEWSTSSPRRCLSDIQGQRTGREAATPPSALGRGEYNPHLQSTSRERPQNRARDPLVWRAATSGPGAFPNAHIAPLPDPPFLRRRGASSLC